jgi:hypothetical protein
MKNGSKKAEPDWEKFGLDGERQPLNPGLISTAAAVVESGKSDKFNGGGGVAVNDNELFADDQVLKKS